MRVATKPNRDVELSVMRGGQTIIVGVRPTAEGRFEIGSEVVPVDSLKFKDQKKYPERLEAALDETGEMDALMVSKPEMVFVYCTSCRGSS